MILNIAIIAFVLMESSNVIILYFAPTFKYGNGVAVFKEYEKSKEDENAHLFAKYMKNWVAGTKLIFIVLLIVILFLGTETLKVYAVAVMILSIATYFFGLHPIMMKLDKNGMLKPVGYSKKLLAMIIGFMLMFGLALGLHFVL